MAGKYRCQKKNEKGKQCVLSPEHIGVIRCRFEGTAEAKEAEDYLVRATEMGYKLPGRKMNKTEQRYADILEGRRLAGEIRSYEFEALTFRLADRCRYTPDFLVEMPDGSMECHEVKGAHIWEDARVKVRVAAARFSQFKFILAQWEKGQWTISEIKR